MDRCPACVLPKAASQGSPMGVLPMSSFLSPELRCGLQPQSRGGTFHGGAFLILSKLPCRLAEAMAKVYLLISPCL